MTYYESAQGVVINQLRAFKEVKDHGASVSEFITEYGNKDFYNAQAVLNWLGY